MNNLTAELTVKTLNCKLTEMAKLTGKHVDLLINNYVPITDRLMETGEIDVDGMTDMFFDMYTNYSYLFKKLETVLAIVESEPDLKDNEEVLAIVEQAKEFDKLTDKLNDTVVSLVMDIESCKFSDIEIAKKCIDLRHTVDCFIRMRDGEKS